MAAMPPKHAGRGDTEFNLLMFHTSLVPPSAAAYMEPSVETRRVDRVHLGLLKDS